MLARSDSVHDPYWQRITRAYLVLIEKRFRPVLGKQSIELTSSLTVRMTMADEYVGAPHAFSTPLLVRVDLAHRIPDCDSRGFIVQPGQRGAIGSTDHQVWQPAGRPAEHRSDRLLRTQLTARPQVGPVGDGSAVEADARSVATGRLYGGSVSPRERQRRRQRQRRSEQCDRSERPEVRSVVLRPIASIAGSRVEPVRQASRLSRVSRRQTAASHAAQPRRSNFGELDLASDNTAS